MELLLNICWVALVLTTLLLRRRAPHRDRRRVALTLACAALLMFPAISITDDLHPSDIPFEDANKRSVQAVPVLQGMQALPSAAPAILRSNPLVRTYQTLSGTAPETATSVFLPLLPGRAPPLLA